MPYCASWSPRIPGWIRPMHPWRTFVSEAPGPVRTQAASNRGILEELRLVEDSDAFLHLALLKLDLLFEKDPARQRMLHGMEQTLEEVERMDWPASPAFRASRTKTLDLDSLFRNTAELAQGDLPGKGKTQASIRRTGPLSRSLIARCSNPRATGSGSA